MLTFDPATASALAGGTSKAHWCEMLKLALGSSPRRVVCKRVASGTATVAEAWDTGTVFRDFDLMGTISTEGAKLSNLGVASGTRVKAAADMSTGTSCLRISNTDGTLWTTGLYGLQASTDADGNPLDSSGRRLDFVRSASPTGAVTEGDAVVATLRPPPFLPSGTGPEAPSWTADTPKYVVYDLWIDGEFVNGEGNVNTEVEFDDRGVDVTIGHPFYAAQLGDVGRWTCTRSLNIGVHHMYPQLFRHHAGCTQSGERPLEAIWISARPVNELPGDWDCYPAMARADGTVVYDRKNPRHSTYPAPGRFRFLNAQRQEIGRKEWPNGPINDPRMPFDEFYDPVTRTHVDPSTLVPTFNTATPPAQDGWRGSGPSWYDSTPGQVVLPPWNIAEPVLWENEIPADMPKRFYAGVEADAMVPYMGKSEVGFNPMNQLLAPDSQADNLYNPWVNGPLPQTRETHPRMQPEDPYAKSPNVSSRSFQPWSTGFDDLVGNPGGQDIYPGPGGMREDRAAIAMRIARFVTDPEGVRLEGAVPHREWTWKWCKNYANLARCFVTGPNLESIPKEQSLAGDWKQNTGYYGAGTGPLSTRINYVGIGNGGNKRRAFYTTGMTAEEFVAANCTDSTGRHPYGYQLPESAHHGYSAAAQALLAFKDIRFAVMQRFFFDTAQMARLGASRPTSDPEDYYGQRTHAWRWADYLWAWLAAGDHPLLYSRQQIEDRFQIELELLNGVYQRVFVVNGGLGENSFFAQGIRRFGQPMQVVESDGYYRASETGGNKFYYLGQIAMLMMTSGLWDRMKARSQGCANGLALVVHSLAKGSIDWVNGTDAKWVRYDGIYKTVGGHFIGSTPTLSSDVQVADLLADWVATAAVLPDPGLADFWHEADGSHVPYEDAPLHCRAQWPSIHKLFFETDYPWVGLDAALAKFKGYYLDRNAWVLLQTPSPSSQSGHNWAYRIASYGFVKPVEVT